MHLLRTSFNEMAVLTWYFFFFFFLYTNYPYNGPVIKVPPTGQPHNKLHLWSFDLISVKENISM